MAHFYVKEQWLKDSKAYSSNASRFSGFATFFGLIGVLFAIGLLIFSFIQILEGDGGWTGVFSAVVLVLQSIMVIIFGAMMRGLSNVVCAIFEMSVSDTRACMELDLPEPQD